MTTVFNVIKRIVKYYEQYFLQSNSIFHFAFSLLDLASFCQKSICVSVNVNSFKLYTFKCYAFYR